MKSKQVVQNQQSKIQTYTQQHNKIKDKTIRFLQKKNSVKSSSSQSKSSSSSSSSPELSSKKDNNKRKASNEMNSQQLIKKIKKQHPPSQQIDQSDQSECNLSSFSMTQKQGNQLDQLNSMKTQEVSKSHNKKKKEVKEKHREIVVDKYFMLGEEYCVFQDKGIIYSTTINQGKILVKKNKFIVIQVLYNKQKKSFLFCTRQGKSGQTKPQQKNLFQKIVCNTKQMAIRLYQEIIFMKSVKGQYKFISHHQDRSNNQQQDNKIKQNKPKKRKNIFIEDTHVSKWRTKDFDESVLPLEIKQLMRTIFDTNMMDKHMKDLGYDINKMPLGKLNQITITKAYKVLKSLLDQVKKQNPNLDQIKQLSHNFYSYIPHNFGFSKMLHHTLRTQVKIKEKLQMLDSLHHIIVARNLMKSEKQNINIIDQSYAKLNRDIIVLPKVSQEQQSYHQLSKIIYKYAKNIHSLQRSSYSLNIHNIFKISNQNQNEKYTQQIGNKKMLWYGSRLTNYVSILSQGLKVPDTQVPETGYSLGKGIYFTDLVTKACNICFANPNNNFGLLLLCQVALGQHVQKVEVDHNAHNLPVGKNSSKGNGKISLTSSSIDNLDGIRLQLGSRLVRAIQTAFLYNQYVVYKPEQVKMKYLVQVQFQFKGR